MSNTSHPANSAAHTSGMPLADVVSRPAAKGDMATGSAEPAANDMVGEVLQKAMIWLAGKCSEESYLHAGFRRDFEITALSESAVLHVFAYTRYQLFVNGEYVGRGPNRFENRRPEYDSWNVRERLRPGRNVVAVLVHRDRPSGRVMHHAPGFTARLDFSLAAGKGQAITTDAAWRGFAETAYGPQPEAWASFAENLDMRRSPGDWTAAEFDPSALPLAVPVDTSDAATWPTPSPRSLPLLRETEIPFTTETKGPAKRENGEFRLEKGAEVLLAARQIVQAYYVIDLEAEGSPFEKNTKDIHAVACRDFCVLHWSAGARLRRIRLCPATKS